MKIKSFLRRKSTRTLLLVTSLIFTNFSNFVQSPASAASCTAMPLAPTYSLVYTQAGVKIEVAPAKSGDNVDGFSWSVNYLEDTNASAFRKWGSFTPWQNENSPGGFSKEFLTGEHKFRLIFSVISFNSCGSSPQTRTPDYGVPLYSLNDPRLIQKEIPKVLLAEIYGWEGSSFQGLSTFTYLTPDVCKYVEENRRAQFILLKAGKCVVKETDNFIPDHPEMSIEHVSNVVGVNLDKLIPDIDPRTNLPIDKNIVALTNALDKAEIAENKRYIAAIAKNPNYFNAWQFVSKSFKPAWDFANQKGYKLVRWESHLGEGFKNSTVPYPTDALSIVNSKTKIAYCYLDAVEVGGPVYWGEILKKYGSLFPPQNPTLPQVLITQSCSSYFKAFGIQ